jgi:hypothetical protein
MMRTPQSFLVAALALITVPVVGCQVVADPDTVEVPRAEPLVRISPAAGGQGMGYSLRMRGLNTQWLPGEVSLDLGPDIQIASVEVQGPNAATAVIMVGETAQLGFRDISVTFQDDGEERTFVLEGDEGYLVETGGFTITPSTARLGETLTIDIVGTNTNFQDGSTWVDFGEGVFVNYVTVTDETHAVASVSIDQRADPGRHDIVVFNGPTGWTLQDGLFVDRTAIAIEIDPSFGNQGEALTFTLLGRNTHFQDTSVNGNRRRTLVDIGGSSICVDETWPNCQDTVRPGGEVTVLNGQLSLGNMEISNGAAPRFYDVRAYVLEEVEINGEPGLQPDDYIIVEEVICHECFEVRPVPINCRNNPGVSLSFNISRNINNDNCSIQERVSAGVTFYTPLDPPCGNAGQMPPPAWDVNGVLMPPPPADCPGPRTCDAGAFVYFESDLNIITMARRENTFTGEIGYSPVEPLTLDDYKFGYIDYDLRAEGSDDPTQIPAFTMTDVLWTLPSDFELLEPLVCENFTHNPAEPLPIAWTPAQTYDVAGLSSLYVTSDSEGQTYQLIAFPWDDGEYEFPADVLTSLPEGGGYFIFGAGVAEPKWFLDFGEGPVGLENQARSGLSYRGFMLLQGDDEEEGQ